MEIRHLKLVKTVAETQSLTRAAEELFVTQSALSHQLKELELFFRIRVFNRVGKRMVLTYAGGRLLKTAIKVINEIENCRAELGNMVGGDQGRIRVSTSCYTSYSWLSAFLTEYRQIYPHVEIDIVTEATQRPMIFFNEGKLDVAILDSHIRGSHVSLRKIFQDEIVLIVNPGHRLARRKIVMPADLCNETYIMHSFPEEESETFRNVFVKNKIRPKHIKQLQLTEGVVEFVKAGIGVAILARWLVSRELQSGQLVGIRITRRGLKRNWYVATSNDVLPEFMQEFVSRLIKYFNSKHGEPVTLSRDFGILRKKTSRNY